MTSPVNLVAEDDPQWIAGFLAAHCGGPALVTRGHLHTADRLSGFRAESRDGTLKGFASYVITGDACEMTSLNSLFPGEGTGIALTAQVLYKARENGCRRVWLVTTNDNVNALRFCQKRGFRLTAVHPGAIEQARWLKPDIPRLGHHAIPIRDEIELEWRL